ncbi:uncharacterized membrane protein YebE (DUF533 family) [Crossiella equi]|uniref:Uncharacterized membrane protein YebE (DUF533 family) n=1 Tax=Crossiella equi TaxID=130796 RepID=A0ABS5A815_9PSEU|nr:hypothetical protein [Crossiella equi]MBP2472407.1 uncharacterized membrane protein YebE (DUF533 family) [Crossiella equi]
METIGNLGQALDKREDGAGATVSATRIGVLFATAIHAQKTASMHTHNGLLALGEVAGRQYPDLKEMAAIRRPESCRCTPRPDPDPGTKEATTD